MSSAAIERRVAPRFAVNCTGELASGSAVVEVRISDMSITGCGTEVVEEPEEAAGALGRTGVLSLNPADSSSPVLFPVLVSNHRQEGGAARLGLQFKRLSMGQMRSLIEVLDGMIEG